MRYVVGIDIGTSSCKTVIVDEIGDIVSSASEEYFAKSDTKGSAFQDPMDWYNAAVETFKNACARADINKKDVAAVGCSGQMQGCTFIGKDGNPVRDSMIWHDTSPIQEAKLLTEQFGELFIKHCHLMPSPALTVSKIKWLMNNEPDHWEATYKFLFAPSFVTYMLSGQMVVDTHNLALSGLNDVESNSWSYELIDIIGIARDKVPELRGCMDIVGGITTRAALDTGIKEGTPVIAGCGDGGAESYSVNIAGKQELKLRLGSASAASAVIRRKDLFISGKGTPYVTPEYIEVSSYTNACARSVKWARGTFFSEMPQTDQTYSLMDKEAAKIPLGANGVMYHPYLGGEYAPYFNSNLRAKFTGINAGHLRGDFLKAIYEGVSFSIRDMLESEEELWKLPYVVFVGGGTKSKIWMSALVDILGKNGVIPKYGDASYGVALMAGDAIGLLNGAKAADRSKEKGTKVFFNAENHEKYCDLFKRYRKLALLELSVNDEK